MKSHSLVVAGLIVAVTAASGADAQAPMGCTVLEESKEIPAVDAVFDSAKLVGALPAVDAAAPSEMVFTLLTGARPIVQNVDSTNKHAVNDETMKQLVAASRAGSREFAPAFKVRVVLGEAGKPLSLNVERSTLCGPEMIGSPPPIQMRTTVRPANAPPPPRPRSVSARLRIGVTGQVKRVDLGSGSGDRDLDQAMRDAMMRGRYRPALLDGRPVEVWVGQGKLEIAR